ncbi:MAG TPA: formate dehydrogenase accessory protein FdhE [Thermoanaerobaculia bacterium]
MIATTALSFEQRGARAALLASSADAAREPLEFASRLCDVQSRVTFPDSLSGRLTKDIHALSQEPVLRMAAEHGPELLAVEADKRLHDDAHTAETRLLVYWGGGAREDYLTRAILQPYVETLRVRNVTPDRLHLRGHCPFCGGAAWISARKPAKDAESGFRYLSCALCALEWQVNRLQCASCFEEDPHKLPVFQTDAHPNVRIETCETCRRYIKSIDLTLDARPIPIVDDLLSIAMDIWAVEQGNTRIEPGLAGL